MSFFESINDFDPSRNYLDFDEKQQGLIIVPITKRIKTESGYSDFSGNVDRVVKFLKNQSLDLTRINDEPLTNLIELVHGYNVRLEKDKKTPDIQLEILMLKHRLHLNSTILTDPILESLINKFEPNEIIDLFNDDFLLDCLDLIQIDERKNIAVDLAFLLKNISNDDEKAIILDAIGKIDQGQREDVINHAIPWLMNITNGEEMAVILEAIGKIDQGQRDDVILHARHWLENIPDGYVKAEIINAIREIDPNQREDVVKHAIPLLKNTAYHELNAAIFKMIEKIDPKHREDVIRCAAPLLKNHFDGEDIGNILKIIGEIDQDQREDVIKYATPWLNNINDSKGMGVILEAIAKIDRGQRKDVIKHATGWLENISDGYVKAEVLTAISQVSENFRSQFMQTIQDIFTKNEHQIDDVYDLFKATLLVQKDQNKIQILQELDNQFKKMTVNVITFSAFYAFFSKEDLLSFDQDILNEAYQDELDQLPLLLFANVQQSASKAIINKLDEVMDDLENLKALLPIAKTFIELINVGDDHPLFWKLTDCELLVSENKSEKNPYVVFNQLKLREAKQIELLSAYPNIGIQLDKLQQTRKQYTFKDLPKVTFDQFEAFYESTTQRLKNLNNDEKKKVEQTLSSLFDPGTILNKTYIDYIIDNSKLIHDPLIEQWVRMQGGPDNICEIHVYKLRVLISKLFKMDLQIGDNGLSEAELNFLDWSLLITNCHAGLKKGIDLAYASLPFESKQEFAYQIAIANLVEEEVKRSVEAVFRNKEFLKKAAEEANLSQVPHFELYLKNSLYLLVGLEHTLTFDQSTGVLNEKLLKKSTKELADLYFTFFTKDLVIHAIAERITRELNDQKTAHTTYDNLRNYFGQENIQKYIEIDEETYAQTFNREGVIKILQDLGYSN